MPLHPQVKTVLDAMAQLNAPPLNEMTPVEARAMFEATRMAPPDPPDLASVEDAKVRTELGSEIIQRMIKDGSILSRPGDDDPAAIELMHKLSIKSRKRWPETAVPAPRLGVPPPKPKAPPAAE